MLVLTRREGESVHIGDDIVVTLFRFRSEEGQVKIGIEAPKSVTILRGELAGRRNGRRDGGQERKGSHQ